MTKTYGVISDLHGVDIRVVPPAIGILKHEGIDALVLNGDLIGERSGLDPADYFAALLEIVGNCGLETYVLMGSHEEVGLCEPILDYFTSKHGNIVNTLRQRKMETPDHHLVFLPGSDWRSGNAVNRGYALDHQNQTGVYSTEAGLIYVVNINDLRQLITDPEKTLVFSHVPRKFANPETCVDMAEFWEARQQFELQGLVCKAGSIFPGPVGSHLAQQGAPIKFKRENRGNKFLAEVFEQTGIRKNITGHFHESAGRTHDEEGKTVEEGLFVSDLFYNASCLDRLMVGMVSVDGTKAAYENINLQEYFR
ncbi:metallophosphoesterase [Candidatus Woesearchaeota archaeon]|nr:metallophosphoesterase [Candidatus Woesearchaeota archaeon]